MEDQQLRLTLVPAPDEGHVSSREFQRELSTFSKTLETHGINASRRWFTMDSPGAGGWGTGEFTLLAALGSTALIQLRKAVETYLKAREGRKLKVKIGSITVEGAASEVEKLISPDLIAKALETSSKAKNKNGK